jgi:transposase
MLGKLVVPVSAHNTSQDCSNCGEKVPKKLHIRWHDCPHCGCSLDRDHNAAIVIKNRAVGQPALKAQSMSYAIAGVTEKPTPMVTACVGVGVVTDLSLSLSGILIFTAVPDKKKDKKKRELRK